MLMNCYVIRNRLSGLSEGILTYKTDDEAAVEACEFLVKVRRRSIDEHDLLIVGTFDNETNDLIPCNPHAIPWDKRRIGNNITAPLAEVEKSINN